METSENIILLFDRMPNLLLLLGVNCLVVVGVYASSEDGMILNPLKRWIYMHLAPLQLPLIGCMVCMSSVHGAWVYVIATWSQPELLPYLPIYILALAGVNTYAYKLYMG